MTRSRASNRPPSLPRTVRVDLLALDLDACGRCTKTEASLDAAVAAVAAQWAAEGVTLDVRKTVVRDAETARRLRFASSPTLRVDGRDVALELRESPCRDCGDLCGCTSIEGGGGVSCRVWVHDGVEHEAAPQAMIADALRAARAAGPAPASTEPFVLPENLRRFFEAVERRDAPGGREAPAPGGCCGAPSAPAKGR